ncbi:MAG: helix-turn-helix transcriptional regulator [Nitrosomonadales bacterium]|nr:helix-turn-helix transcriptional regulator [Nitrosomonadales bacterium]
MSYSGEDVLKLVGMTYDAALDESKWESFITAFANAVDGKSALLCSVDYDAGKASFNASYGFDPVLHESYVNHFVHLDYFATFFNTVPLNTVETTENSKFALIPSARKKTEFYNDYLRASDSEYAMGAAVIRDGNHMVQFSALRGRSATGFDADQMNLMSLLSPHVARAVQVHRKIHSITVEKEWALGALDQLRLSVILTNISGTPLFANRAAEVLLAEGYGIGTRQGKLILSNLSETARLYKLIDDAAKGVPGSTWGGDMRIALPGGECLHCVVTPIPLEFTARWNIGLASGCVAVFLSKPGGLQLPPQRLAEMYGLTPAEGRLAGRLAALRNVLQAADDLCISVHTARSQLKSIFAKTGVQSQSELLVLLATGTLAHCRSGKSV